MMSLPENFKSLNKGEEFIRSKSIEAIEQSENILAHIQMIERSMDLIDYFARKYTSENEDQLLIQCLGIRLFNGAAAAFKLLLSGYYQASGLQQRDLLETTFLLDYFTTDQKLIGVWKIKNKDKKTKELFKPVNIRNALDNRDKYTGRKRGAAYKLFCELAAHPTYEGFRMLTPIPGGNAHCGPFFEFTAMKATIEELTKVLVQAGTIFTRFFKGKKRPDYEMKILFTEASVSWFEKFYDSTIDHTPVKGVRDLLAKVKFQDDMAE